MANYYLRQQQLEDEYNYWIEKNKKTIKDSTKMYYTKDYDFVTVLMEGSIRRNLFLMNIDPGTVLEDACHQAIYCFSDDTLFDFNGVFIHKKGVTPCLLRKPEIMNDILGQMFYQYEKKPKIKEDYGTIFNSLEELINLNRIAAQSYSNSSQLTKKESVTRKRLIDELSMNERFYNLIANEYLNSEDETELSTILTITSKDCAANKTNKLHQLKNKPLFDHYQEQYDSMTKKEQENHRVYTRS